MIIATSTSTRTPLPRTDIHLLTSRVRSVRAPAVSHGSTVCQSRSVICRREPVADSCLVRSFHVLVAGTHAVRIPGSRISKASLRPSNFQPFSTLKHQSLLCSSRTRSYFVNWAHRRSRFGWVLPSPSPLHPNTHLRLHFLRRGARENVDLPAAPMAGAAAGRGWGAGGCSPTAAAEDLSSNLAIPLTMMSR